MGSVYVLRTAYNRIRAAVAIGRKLSELAYMNFSRTTSYLRHPSDVGGESRGRDEGSHLHLGTGDSGDAFCVNIG